MPDAATITVLETLELLDGDYARVAEGVSSGSYSFWLGSGISRGRVIGLDGVLAKLLEFLRGQALAEPAGSHRAALDTIINLADPSGAERAQIDFEQPVADWPCASDLIKRLWNKYSAVLSVELPTEKLDYLLWTGLDFTTTFAEQAPDAEHLAIAILALEGAVTEFASANWDGLIEAAMRELGHDEGFFRVTVTGEDLRNPAASARLYKFHGCALRAIENEDDYRNLLIARSLQISGWATNEKFKIVRDRLTSLAQTSRTFMIGLSAQDADIKWLFAEANKGKSWHWDDEQTPVVISAEDLGPDHKELLGLVYGEATYEENRKEICRQTRLRAYAKPLLVALLLKVLTDKIVVLADDAKAPGLSPAERSVIAEGIKILRNRVAEADNGNRLELVRTIATGLARARHQLQNGTSAAGPQSYFAIDDKPAHLMRGKLALQSSGQREAAMALGLIGLDDGTAWTTGIDDPADPRSGALRLSSSNASARLFFAANDDKIGGLLEDGAFLEDDADAVIICSGKVTDRQPRNPSGWRRDGSLGTRYLSIGPMLNDASDLDDLRDRFREEIGL